MKKLSINIVFLFTILVISIIPIISAEASPWPTFNVCCEKTLNGAWCQNTLKENCDSNFIDTPTSCEATSFCKPSICFNSIDGLCMENTPQRVCNAENGTWVDESVESVPQCNLGCCVLGTQASFVTLTRCKKLAGEYGLKTDFRINVLDELSCISIAATQDQGACVFESEFQRTCRFTTRGECLGVENGEGQTSSAEFFKDYLCSAEELATNCGPTTSTTCVDGKDEVYFLDSCGNPANIYDSQKIYDRDASYWEKTKDKSEVECSDNNGNSGSPNCGDCDYFKGSICSEGKASYGDYFCENLDCDIDGDGKKDYDNGESWCVNQGNVGEGADAVGSRHFRHVCINGEETIEPCADFRNEVCLEGEIDTSEGTFIEAACRVNRWKDCIDQDNEEDCANTDRRDCYWLSGTHFTGLIKEGASSSSTSSSSPSSFSANTPTFGMTGNVVSPITGQAIFGGDDEEESEKSSGVQLGGGSCLPNVAPGLKFWNDGDASSICSLGNSKCVVEYEKGLIGKEKVIENEECLEESYAQSMNNICIGLGDCGAYVNIANKYTDDGAEWKVKGAKRTLSQGIMNAAKKKAGINI